MHIKTALSEIKQFWNPAEAFPFGKSDNSAHLNRIKSEFNFTIPDALSEYITQYAPANNFYFTTVGNPMAVYGINHLKYEQDGYNYNRVKQETIEGWNASYFIIADEGADPVILNLNNMQDGIQKLMHGAGSWDNGETIADTLGQFLLCSAALHYALTGFEEEPIVDDEKGFNLAKNAADWYFKRMKSWAGKYYDAWWLVFDNN